MAHSSLPPAACTRLPREALLPPSPSTQGALLLPAFQAAGRNTTWPLTGCSCHQPPQLTGSRCHSPVRARKGSTFQVTTHLGYLGLFDVHFILSYACLLHAVQTGPKQVFSSSSCQRETTLGKMMAGRNKDCMEAEDHLYLSTAVSEATAQTFLLPSGLSLTEPFFSALCVSEETLSCEVSKAP